MPASAPGSSGQIFISYRREETAYPAGWLFDRLAGQFGEGRVFKDVDSIQPGDDFTQVITAAVESSAVLLALIGNRWLTITGDDGRPRLDDPGDFVRLEIETALARNVRVVPILIEGARMPRADQLPASMAKLVHRQALELSPGRFNADTGPLLRMLERILTELQAPPAVTDPEVTAVAAPTDAADEQLGGGTWPELEPLPISAEPTLRSHVSDQDTEVEFVNGRSEAVVIYWLDFGGRRIRYHRLPPGASYVQPTFVTHPWVITTTDNRPLVIIQPTSEPRRITIR